jgi:NAD-dependent dihydropyrimidine dehydrogenase PreA subunit
MAKPKPVVDPQKCDPALCNGGICAALAECPHKIFRQEEPGEMPYIRNSDLCRGCFACLSACPAGAIIKIQS